MESRCFLKKPLNTVQYWYFVALVFLPVSDTDPKKEGQLPSKKAVPKDDPRKPHLPPIF